MRGVAIDGDSGRQTVRARRGVIIASGGFEHNAELRERYLPPEAVENYSSGARTNTGGGQMAAERAGAALAQMDDA